jgi:hypothetical protein
VNIKKVGYIIFDPETGDMVFPDWIIDLEKSELKKISRYYPVLFHKAKRVYLGSINPEDYEYDYEFEYE